MSRVGPAVRQTWLKVAAGIETGRGPWVTALIAAGYLVFPVNPLQASRYRERHGVSRATSGAGDAHMLADMVRAGSRQLRPAAGDSPEAEAVKVLARAHTTTARPAGTTPRPAPSPALRARSKVLAARFIHNDRLIDALMAQALAALSASLGARAFYDELRARGIERTSVAA
jgi:hypothetical protein